MPTVTILHAHTQKVLATFTSVEPSTSIRVLKETLSETDKKFKFERISLRKEPTSKILSNDFRISDIPNVDKVTEVTLYYKDLGPQVSWNTTFYAEYAGPPIVYALVWALHQPGLLAGNYATPMRNHFGLRQLFLACYIGHFLKRILETRFIHRFSHATMPIASFFRNCAYYWLFAFAIAHFTNHPLYMRPTFGMPQVYTGLAIFLVGEMGNFACHLALRDLRPEGSTVRRVPRPVPGSPLTFLFSYVACPNYTYEVMSWIGFCLMTQSLPGVAFTLFGFITMAQWARNKLLAYKTEFPASYPVGVKAIVPFVY